MTTAHSSPPGLLALHALRLKGVGKPATLARRFAQDPDEVSELMLDFEACGWVRRVEFAGAGGWALTEAGRVENERQLAAELAESGAGPALADSHRAFLPLNARFLTACTNWRIRPLPGDSMATNDHTDFRWDDRVLDELGTLGRRLQLLGAELADLLGRFEGYPERYAAALTHIQRGQRSWLDEPGLDSCHAVWFEFHEDLIATLGIQRGEESWPGSTS